MYETFDMLSYIVGFEKFFSLCDSKFIINGLFDAMHRHLYCQMQHKLYINHLSILDFLFVIIDDEIDDMELLSLGVFKRSPAD